MITAAGAVHVVAFPAQFSPDEAAETMDDLMVL